MIISGHEDIFKEISYSLKTKLLSTAKDIYNKLIYQINIIFFFVTTQLVKIFVHAFLHITQTHPYSTKKDLLLFVELRLSKLVGGEKVLKRVLEKDNWKTALQNQKGVYLLTDKSNGKMYVGSAYGENMILERWRAYIATGHGGNVGLKKLNFDHII